MTDERFCRYLSRRFFAPGYDAEDMLQEARIAMWQAPKGIERLCARRRLIEIVRRARRGGRPSFVELVEAESPENIFDICAARERLHGVLVAPLSDLERTALGRAIRGEACPRPLDNALYRARKKLVA